MIKRSNQKVGIETSTNLGKKMLKIRQELSEHPSGWQDKQVMDIIYKKTGVRYPKVHLYRLLHKWDFSAKVP
jgi:transposase